MFRALLSHPGSGRVPLAMAALSLAVTFAACSDEPTRPTPAVPNGPSLTTSGAVIAVTPASLTFPDEFVTLNTEAMTVTVKNVGIADLEFTAALGGKNPRDFMEYGTPTCGWGWKLTPGESCVFSLSFIPSDTGMRSASLDITSNGGNASVGLWGYGRPPAPILNIAPTALSFADQLVGNTSATQQLTIINDGTGQMHITSWELGGENAGDFVVSVPSDKWACKLNLGMNYQNECHLNVAFAPTAAGGRSAVLRIRTAEGPAAFIDLSGNATALADLSVSFATTATQVQAGKNLSYAISVGNAGPGAAWGFILSDAIPTGTTFVSILAPSDVSCDTPAVGGTGMVACEMGNWLPKGASRSVQIVVKALARGTVKNTAVVSSATPETDFKNNNATVTTTVVGKK